MWILSFFMMFSLSWGSQPPSRLYVPANLSGNPWDNGYPEHRFNLVLSHLKKIYKPIIEAKGGVFKIKSDWGDGAVNMWADRIGQEYWLEVPGGMARYHLITEEGFISSLCHELGHLLGGMPSEREISYEGQSDYWAGQECVAAVLKDLPPYQTPKLDPEVHVFCGNDTLCERTVSGFKSLTALYGELENSGAPKIQTPSSLEAAETLRAHPPAQCRLDTFLAGYRFLPRPKCWFKSL